MFKALVQIQGSVDAAGLQSLVGGRRHPFRETPVAKLTLMDISWDARRPADGAMGVEMLF